MEATLLFTTVAVVPIPPDVEKTRVKMRRALFQCVCVHACLYTCVCAWVFVCMCVFLIACVCLCVSVCVCV